MICSGIGTKGWAAGASWQPVACEVDSAWPLTFLDTGSLGT